MIVGDLKRCFDVLLYYTEDMLWSCGMMSDLH